MPTNYYHRQVDRHIVEVLCYGLSAFPGSVNHYGTDIQRGVNQWNNKFYSIVFRFSITRVSLYYTTVLPVFHDDQYGLRVTVKIVLPSSNQML